MRQYIYVWPSENQDSHLICTRHVPSCKVLKMLAKALSKIGGMLAKHDKRLKELRYLQSWAQAKRGSSADTLGSWSRSHWMTRREDHHLQSTSRNE